MEWLNLLSGLIGAIVGSIATLAGSVWAANKTVKGAIDMASKERYERERVISRSSVSSLLAEIRDNLQLSRETPANHTLVPFLTDMWEVHKGTITFLPLDTQEIIRQGYAAAVLANAIAARDLHQLKFLQGYLESDYKQRAGKVKDSFEKAEQALQKYLDGAN